MLPKSMVLLSLCKIGLVHNAMNSTWTGTAILTTHHNHWVEIIGVVNEVSITVLAALKMNSIWVRGALFV